MVRFKNRYLLCIIDSEYDQAADSDIFNLHARQIMATIRASLSLNFGDLAVGQLFTSLAVKLWSPALGMCIIRSSRDHVRTVWAAVSLVTAIEGVPSLGLVRLHVVHVGGTIRSCQKSATEHAQHIIVKKKSKGVEANRLEAAASSFKQDMDTMEV